MMLMKCEEHIIDDFRTYLGNSEAVVVDFAVSLSATLRFFIRTWLTSSGPKWIIAANTGIPNVSMIQTKCEKHIIDDFRTYLGHRGDFAIDFSVFSWVKQRFFIRTWLTSSAPEMAITASTGLSQVPMMQMKF
jgi:hypothetical protein